MFRKTTRSLSLSKDSPKIILTTDTGFLKINMLQVIGNKINKFGRPLGIRWTLLCENNQYDCFCWQFPNQFEFNCFELIHVFGFMETEFTKNASISQSSELHIKIETEAVEKNLIIDIKLEVDEKVI